MNQHQMSSIIEVKREPESPGFDHCCGSPQQHGQGFAPKTSQIPRQKPDDKTESQSDLVRCDMKCNDDDDSLKTQRQYEEFEPKLSRPPRQESDTTKAETRSDFVHSQTRSHQTSRRSNSGEGSLEPQNFQTTREDFRQRSNTEGNADNDNEKPLTLRKTREKSGNKGEDHVYPTETTQSSTANTSQISADQTSPVCGYVEQEVETDNDQCQPQNLCLVSAKNRHSIETDENSFQPQNVCSSRVRDGDCVDSHKKLFQPQDRHIAKRKWRDKDDVKTNKKSSPHSRNLTQSLEGSVWVRQEAKNDIAEFQGEIVFPARVRVGSHHITDKSSSPLTHSSELCVRIKQEVESDSEELDQQNHHKIRGVGLDMSLNSSHQSSSLQTLNLSRHASSFHPVKLKQEMELDEDRFELHSFQKMKGNNFETFSNSAVGTTQDQCIPNMALWANHLFTNSSVKTGSPLVVNVGQVESDLPDENNSMRQINQPTTNSIRSAGPVVVNFGDIKSEFPDGNDSQTNQQKTHSSRASATNFGNDASDESDCDTLPVHFEEQYEEESFEHENFYVCGICDSAHHIPYDLSEHFSHHIRDDRSFRCGSCQETFQHIAPLTQHVLVHTFASGNEFQQNDPNSFACHMCSKMFRRLYELNRHQKIHLGEKPFVCDVCSKAFSRTDELNRHKKVHIGYKPFQCDQCQKAFLTNHELTQHKKTHSEEKPFACHLCPRAFSRADKLFHHGKIHTGHRSYPCDICHKAFITQSQLNQHKKIHSGEKPFVCDICHKAYLKNNDLSRHMKMHTGQKPYACETCGKAFHRADILTRHKRTHNKVKRGKRTI